MKLKYVHIKPTIKINKKSCMLILKINNYNITTLNIKLII